MRTDRGLPRFLLLLGRETGIWSLPKGHPELADASPLNTAIRETYEETRLQPYSDYTLIGDVQRFGKRPYWIGHVNEQAVGRVRLAQREHSAAGWFTLAEIAGLKTNVDVRAWLKKAQSYNSNFVARLAAAGVTLPGCCAAKQPTHSCDAECNAS